MKQIVEQKNLKKQDTTLTDYQIIEIDDQIRESKVGKRYTATSPDNVVRCLNEIDNDMGADFSRDASVV